MQEDEVPVEHPRNILTTVPVFIDVDPSRVSEIVGGVPAEGLVATRVMFDVISVLPEKALN